MAKKIVIAAGAVGFAAAAAASAVYFGIIGLPGAGKARQDSGAAAKASAKPPKVALIDVKELTLRLSDKDVEHYIKLTPVLAVREACQSEIEARVPLVRDRMVAIVTAHSAADLATVDGAANLKKQMLDALSRDFANNVIDIYFSGYLVE